MKLVEVVRHPRASDAALALAVAVAEKLGKTPITVTDRPGFASSRLGLVIGLEAMPEVCDTSTLGRFGVIEIGELRLPQRLDPEVLERRIARHELALLQSRLRGEHAIEGIAMFDVPRTGADRVRGADPELAEASACDPPGEVGDERRRGAQAP
jgi:hypothetical protein